MTFGELKNYVVEAIGEDVISVDRLIAGVRAGFGDMIHRGYRSFKYVVAYLDDIEKMTEYQKLTRIRYPEQEDFHSFFLEGNQMATIKFPKDALEILYIKVFFNQNSFVATKLALSNPVIQSKNISGQFRTPIEHLDYENTPFAIYYKKGDELYIEWDRNKIFEELYAIEIGYYKNLPFISELELRKMQGITLQDTLDIEDMDIPIEDDYANVLVNYMIWYIALSEAWDPEQVHTLKNEYKYSMEDLLARRNKEDQYDESTTVIRTDGVI